jgi:hypothetical protein
VRFKALIIVVISISRLSSYFIEIMVDTSPFPSLFSPFLGPVTVNHNHNSLCTQLHQIS